MIIDFHTHVFSPWIKQNRGRYVDRDPNFALLYADGKARMATTDELIESMDKNGVDISVIVNYGWSTHDLCVETNDYILESVARHPRRLIGFGAVQPYAGEAALAEIERCVSGGIRGIGELRPDLQMFDLADRGLMLPLVERLRQHGLMLMVHASEPVGHLYPGKGTVYPDMLYPFITTFSDITLICAHWGGGLPFYALMPEVKKAMDNTYFDTAASPFLYSPDIYGQVSRLVGAGKILFGTDYPLISPARYLKEINAAGLSGEEKDLLLGGNALKLLGIGD
ncbi:amidohydrolase family protein [Chloroflexota bacterium]